MQSIENNKKYLEEYKEQFRNMTDEEIEQHIGLEQLRNVIDGLDKNHGIDEIRKIVKEIKQEKETDNWSITFLNPEDIDNIIEERKKQYEEIKDFINKNPYPKQKEMTIIIQTTIEKGFPSKPLKQLYNRNILEKLYHNLFDEEKIIDIGKEMNDIEITGANDEHKFRKLIISTNLHILQTILEYNYNKNYNNKEFSKMNIIRFPKIISTIWNQHFDFDL